MLEQIEIIEFLQSVNSATYCLNYEGDLQEKLLQLNKSYEDSLCEVMKSHGYYGDICIDLNKDNYIDDESIDRKLKELFAYFFEPSVDPDYEEPIDPTSLYEYDESLPPRIPSDFVPNLDF